MSEKKLFSPFTVKDVTFKNRIVMSPMCMYSCLDQTGLVNDWHVTHYTSRAVGQVGLVILESTAVAPQGRISSQDLGIWSDEHIEGLKKLVELNHKNNSKIGIQLNHAGRKAVVDGPIIAPSVLAFNDEYELPTAMTKEDIRATIDAFKDGARRAHEAGFDVIELHGAHGYLINQFLSPISNKRTDEYGGRLENRYLFLSEVIEAVKTVWNGPLFVRVSATDHLEGGCTPEDHVFFAKKMKAQGVDLIDCSSGGIAPAKIDAFPGYQISYSEQIRRETGMATGGLGLILNGVQAEEILKNNRADLIIIARALLRDPYWAYSAARELGVEIESPVQYERGWRF